MSYVGKTYLRLLNFWIAFSAVILASSFFPHNEMPFVSWTNYSLYSLIFLLSVFVAKKEVMNKDIFINLAIFAGFICFSFTSLFVGDKYMVGGFHEEVMFFQYRRIISYFLLSFAVIYICVKYVFLSRRILLNYLITLAVVVPFTFLAYGSLIWEPHFFCGVDDFRVLYKGSLYMVLFTLSFIVLYGILLYKYENTLGEYIDELMSSFFLLVFLHFVGKVSYLYEIELFEVEQYVLFALLSIMVVTLCRKLSYVHSEFGIFYDKLLGGSIYRGVKIKRRRSRLSYLGFRLIKLFSMRVHTFGFIAFAGAFIVSQMPIPQYVKVNIFAAGIAILAILSFTAALYERRLHSDEVKLK